MSTQPLHVAKPAAAPAAGAPASNSTAPIATNTVAANQIGLEQIAAQRSAARRPSDARDEGVVRVMRDDGSLDPAGDPGLEKADAIALFEMMLRVRILDDRLVTLQRQGRIGFHIGSLGEEAAIRGSAFALRDQD